MGEWAEGRGRKGRQHEEDPGQDLAHPPLLHHRHHRRLRHQRQLSSLAMREVREREGEERKVQVELANIAQRRREYFGGAAGERWKGSGLCKGWTKMLTKEMRERKGKARRATP